jgi:hypothetical protein
VEVFLAVKSVTAIRNCGPTVNGTTVVIKAGTSVVGWAAVGVARVIGIETTVGVEPRAGSDEDSTGEPLRPVVAVGGAGVGGIGVVAVGAGGRCYVHRNRSGGYADAYSDRDLGRV